MHLHQAALINANNGSILPWFREHLYEMRDPVMLGSKLCAPLSGENLRANKFFADFQFKLVIPLSELKNLVTFRVNG